MEHVITSNDLMSISAAMQDASEAVLVGGGSCPPLTMVLSSTGAMEVVRRRADAVLATRVELDKNVAVQCLRSILCPILAGMRDGRGTALHMVSHCMGALVSASCPSSVAVHDERTAQLHRVRWHQCLEAVRDHVLEEWDAAIDGRVASNGAPMCEVDVLGLLAAVICPRCSSSESTQLLKILKRWLQCCPAVDACPSWRSCMEAIVHEPDVLLLGTLTGRPLSQSVVISTPGSIVLPLRKSVNVPEINGKVLCLRFVWEDTATSSGDDDAPPTATDTISAPSNATEWLLSLRAFCTGQGVAAVITDSVLPPQLASRTIAMPIVQVSTLTAFLRVCSPAVMVHGALAVVDALGAIVHVRSMSSIASHTALEVQLEPPTFGTETTRRLWVPPILLALPAGDNGAVWRSRQSAIVDAFQVVLAARCAVQSRYEALLSLADRLERLPCRGASREHRFLVYAIAEALRFPKTSCGGSYRGHRSIGGQCGADAVRYPESDATCRGILSHVFDGLSVLLRVHAIVR